MQPFGSIQKRAKKVKAYPLCIEFIDDGYYLYWYCDQCVKKYGLSNKGTYIYDAEERLVEEVSGLDGYVLSDDQDQAPFSDFMDNETKDSLFNEEFLQSFLVEPGENIPVLYPNMLRVPFGARKVD